MGIFNSIFQGRKKQNVDKPSPGMRQIFEKLSAVMEDEQLQNSMNHPLIREKISGGLDVDKLPHGIGDFGRCGENPIPVNGALGEMVYLSLLQTNDTHKRLLFHRLGSVEGLDVYETVSLDGRRWDILFFSMYHPRRSRIAPMGYILTDPRSQPLLYGTNRRVTEFPIGLREAIRQTTEEVMGIPLPPPEVRQAEENVRFERPREHDERILTALKSVESFRG